MFRHKILLNNLNYNKTLSLNVKCNYIYLHLHQFSFKLIFHFMQRKKNINIKDNRDVMITVHYFNIKVTYTVNIFNSNKFI